MHDGHFFIFTVLLGLYAMLDPISHTVMFMSIVKKYDPGAQRRIAKKACIFVFVFVSLFILSGELIFKLFDTTLAAFQISGGAIIFFTGFGMLKNDEHAPVEDREPSIAGNLSEDVAYSPLGTPLIAGPGVITAAMNFTGMDKSFDIVNILIVVSILGIMCLVNYICFVCCHNIIKKLGMGTIRAVSKIMGIIIIAIATQMIINGIKSAFNIG